MIAVPTLTAPSTPIDWCTRTGMNVRVAIVPPCAGGATSEILGTVVALTSPSPIALPAARRSSWTRRFSSASASRSATDSRPLLPKLDAAATTTGIPLSTQVTGMPPNVSVTFPVGNTLAAAPESSKSRTIAAAVPGTPSIAVCPS